MKHSKDIDWNFWAFLFVSAGLLYFSVSRVNAGTRPVMDRCMVRLDNRGVAKVGIAVDGTVLDFPLKPSKVILGRKGTFGIEYVESDLAISPLSPGSKSHLYVYLEGRRFTFELSTIMGGGCPIITVRDARDNQVSVDGFFRSKK
jgi:hypothetical protein